MTTQEKIAVMQAHVDGKKVQFKLAKASAWSDCTVPLWGWSEYDYRIKPEPRRWWINPVPMNGEGNAIAYTKPLKGTIEVVEVLS